jgi:hypothetical protein
VVVTIPAMVMEIDAGSVWVKENETQIITLSSDVSNAIMTSVRNALWLKALM